MRQIQLLLQRMTTTGWLISFAVFLLLVTAGIYAPSLKNGFVDWDDGMLIRENAIVQHPSISSMRTAFSTYDPELYIPLTFMSYQLDQRIGKGSPYFFHLTSLLLHLANIALVIALASLLTRKQYIAAAVGFLFALHPIQVEAVAWASGRKDVLSSFFLLLSLVCYVQFAIRHRRGWWYAALGIFALGLFSKVTVAVEPLLLLLIDWLLKRRSSVASQTMEKIPFFLLSIIFGIVALFGKRTIVASLTVSETVLMFIKSVAFYLQKSFLPFGFSVLYPLDGPISVFSLAFLLPVLCLLLITLAFVRWGRRDRLIIFGTLWFLILLLPAFLTFKGKADLYIASDRYVYVACIGLFIIIARFFELVMQQWPKGRQNILAFLLVPLIVLPSMMYRQSLVWRSTETLFQHTVRLYPLSYVAHSALGNVLTARGDTQHAAMEYYVALKLHPDLAGAYTALATALRPTGSSQFVEWLYRKALDIDPTYESADAGLGILALDTGNVDEAIWRFERAISHFTILTAGSKKVEIYNNLATAYDAKGWKELEIEQYRIALDIDPTFAVGYYNLGQVLRELGREQEAREAFRKALQLKPDFKEARKALSRE